MSVTVKKEAPAELEEVQTDAVESILSVEASLKDVVVGRSKEIRAITLALMTGQHVMMEGEPGIAKTLLAKEYSSHIIDKEFKMFKTQLTRGMVSDQLLGPTSLSKLRTQDTYEFNTKGMLPDCHFAILDEVYRGPEMLLPVILSILNERDFHNGNKVQKCPLITAVGTTNFTTETEELKAFHDRWLINCAVTRLSSAEERIEMLVRSNRPQAPRKGEISLTDIRALQKDRMEVKIPPTIYQLYDGMVQKIIAAGKGKLRFGITDRRVVQALRLAQAAAVLQKRREVTPDDLCATEFGLICKGIAEEESIYSNAYGAEIGNYQTIQKEAEDLGQLKELRDKLYQKYVKGMPKEQLLRIQGVLRETIKQYRGRQFTTASNNAVMGRLYKEFEELLSEVASDLS